MAPALRTVASTSSSAVISSVSSAPGPTGARVSEGWRLRNVQGPNSRLAKATKKGLAEGSMWLGDVYVSQTDAEDRALILESHYGYRWFRVAWAVGSNLEGYPWPFREPVQSLPMVLNRRATLRSCCPRPHLSRPDRPS